MRHTNATIRHATRNILQILACLALLFPANAYGQEDPAQAEAEPILTSKRIRLSYIDPTRCMTILSLYGVRVGSAGKPADLKSLPVVHALPSTKHHDTLPKQDTTFPQTETDPINELIIFYDANQPAQYSDHTNHRRAGRPSSETNYH